MCSNSMAAATINNIVARTLDVLAGEAAGIAGRVKESPSAGFDKTTHNDCGVHWWANVAQSGPNVSIQISKSRATLMRSV